MINELANDYSAYLKLDISKEISTLEETIEDMLTRLEEFESLVDMVRSDGTQCLQGSVPMIYACHKELQKLFDRIDHLESFIGRVRHDLDMVEHHLDAAETDVGSEGAFKTILKPLFFFVNKIFVPLALWTTILLQWTTIIYKDIPDARRKTKDDM